MIGSVDTGFRQIDTNQWFADALAHEAYIRYGRPGTDFDDDKIVHGIQPVIQSLLLLCRSALIPFPVAKHQDIRARQPAAMNASGQFSCQ